MKRSLAAFILLLAVGCTDTNGGVDTGAGTTGPTVVETTPQSEPPTTAVPNVEGEKLANARNSIEQAGLSLFLETKLSHQPSGTVLSQSLAPGEDVPAGETIRLVVAEAFPVIPDVVGDKLSDARRTLSESGFDVRVVREVSSQPKDTVISQSPQGRTEARPGRQVTIVVAKPAPSSDETNCTSGYSPCLPPASDYDCIGGSGDGPEYTGTVQVTGSDPYGLDSDNDGIGCE